SPLSLTLAVMRAKRTICKTHDALRRTADPAALEVRAVQVPADTAGCPHLRGIEQRALDRLDPLRAEQREARDHARDAGARKGSLDRAGQYTPHRGEHAA